MALMIPRFPTSADLVAAALMPGLLHLSPERPAVGLPSPRARAAIALLEQTCQPLKFFPAGWPLRACAQLQDGSVVLVLDTHVRARPSMESASGRDGRVDFFLNPLGQVEWEPQDRPRDHEEYRMIMRRQNPHQMTPGELLDPHYEVLDQAVPHVSEILAAVDAGGGDLPQELHKRLLHRLI